MNPTRLGPYTIRGRLGRGGMGTVFEAADEAGGLVAIKTLTAGVADDPAMRRRFEAEIEALKALRHPGIVRLLSFGEEDGRPFFAMELVRGRSIEELLRAGQRFDWRRTVAVAAEITRALKSAHDQGIVHRDLKPANLLFPDEPGDGASVKLADFGIARLFGDAGHTQAGTVVGTAEYMAPEQAAGEPVDARVDLYSLGLVMYAMITGQPPFRGGSVSEVLRRQRRETPPRVAAIVPGIPASLDNLIGRLLAKRPDDRPASALAVGRVLAAIEAAGGSVAESPVTVRDVRPGDGTGATPAATIGSGQAVSAGTSPGAAAVDGEAVTRPFAASTSAQGGSLAHRPTAPDAVVSPAGRPRPDSRFTTVEELHRSVREEADRTARRDRLVRLVVAAGLLAVAGVVAYPLLRAPTADEVHARIEAMRAAPEADLRDARPLMERFVERFPGDPRAADVRGLLRTLQLDALERRARRRPRADAGLEPLERDYRAALDREAESPVACLAALEAILALHAGVGGAAESQAGRSADSSLWLDLVRRQIQRVAPLADRERREDAARAEATLGEAAAIAAAARVADDAAARDSLLARRRDLLGGLVEMYASRPHVAGAVAEARRLLEAETSSPAPEPGP